MYDDDDNDDVVGDGVVVDEDDGDDDSKAARWFNSRSLYGMTPWGRSMPRQSWY